jgi:protein-L-isoaspartate(D-aspartate) O-methyltransferase
MIPDFVAARRVMVETQLRAKGIRDERVLDAMLNIPREEFVPLGSRWRSYLDEPIPIGYGQTISQPYMTALMAQELELTGGESVLEVGAGCGYAAAVLAQLAARVLSVEIVPELARLAKNNLCRVGSRAIVAGGDGGFGYAGRAPYDAISVAAGAPEIPAALLNQLGDPGRLVIPVGSPDQELRVVTKQQGHIESRVAAICRFVPLRGEEGWA